MKYAYVFRGAPGAGKTTVVSKIAKGLKGKVVYLQQDMFRWDFHVIGREFKDVADEEHRLAYHNMLHMLESYCRYGEYTIVVDGIFTWNDQYSSQGTVIDILSILGRYGYLTQCFVLLADKDTMWKRNKVRTHPVLREEFDHLYLTINGALGPYEIVVDNTDDPIKETVKEIQKVISQSSER
jgi:hypothetical protein